MTALMTALRRRLADRPLAAAVVALLATAALYSHAAPATVSTPPTAGRLIVADLRGDALVVIDLGGARPRHIALPGGPHELLQLPDGRIVASLEQAGVLAVIEIDSGAVEIVVTGGLPHGLGYDAGTLFVTDREAGAVRRMIVDGWSELAPLPAAEMPHAVAVLAGGTIAVANAGDDTLQLGDRLIAVSALPETVATDRDGLRVAIVGALGGALDVFAADGSPLLHVALGGRPVRAIFGPRGERIAVALSAEASVALVDMSGGVRRVPVGGVPDGLAFDASGRYLFVSDLSRGAVSVVDVLRGEVTQHFDAASSAGALLVLSR